MALASLLGSLPSRGLLTSVQPGSAFVSAPVPYIADHETAPPEDQVVKTDPSGLLIRSLQSKKAREDKAKKQAKAAADKGKRPAPADGAEGQKVAKRRAGGSDGAGPSSAGGGAGSSQNVPQPAQAEFSRGLLQSKTVKELQAILKEWGLTVSGKKEDLIARIMTKQEAAQGRQ